MKAYRNTKEIERKEALGRRFSMIGLLILFIGMMASFVPNWYPPDMQVSNSVLAFIQHYWALGSLIALPAGFLSASIGSYFINRFAKRRWPDNKAVARPDEMLERGMKGFDDKYAYFAYSLPDSNYAVAGPCGILLFAVRGDKGRVMVEGDRWREPFSVMRFFTVFAREGVGNPNRELADQTAKMEKLLQHTTSNNGAAGDEESKNINLSTVPIEGAAVFLNSDAQLEVDSATIPVLRLDQVKEYIRRKTREVKLSGAQVRALHEFLRAHSEYQEE
ncbi:MAG: hypothetical protein R3C14_06000 [Caldilineaceae bacterium]